MTETKSLVGLSLEQHLDLMAQTEDEIVDLECRIRDAEEERGVVEARMGLLNNGPQFIVACHDDPEWLVKRAIELDLRRQYAYKTSFFNNINRHLRYGHMTTAMDRMADMVIATQPTDEVEA